MSKCPNCSKPLDDNNLLKCPHCHIDVPTYIRVNLENLKKSQDFLTGYKQSIDNEVERKVKAQIWKYVGILSLLCLGGLLAIYFNSRSLTERIVSAKLDREFKEPQLKQTLSNAAKTETQDIIKKEISPDIESTKLAVAKEFSLFKSYLESSKARLGQEYDALVKQLALLKARNHLAQLANVAISEGKRQALEEMEKISRNPSKIDLAEVAAAEIMRVKAFYATTNKIKDQSVKYNSASGIVIVDDKIPTSNLIYDLEHNSDWRVRTKFAQLLSNRKEAKVPEALLKAASSDQNLDVVKAALESFTSLTGFRGNDIFDYSSAQKWWEQNKK